MNKFNISYFVVAIFLAVSCGTAEKTSSENDPNSYNLILELGEVELKVPAKKTAKHLTIYNNQEQIILDLLGNDSVQAKFPVFDSGLKFYTENTGIWKKFYLEDYEIPFRLEKTKKLKIVDDSLAYEKYQVVFSPNSPDQYPAIGLFKFDKQNGYAIGSFATETGDYRHLVGEIKNNHFQLNTLDGSHAFVFTGDLKHDSIVNGMFYSGTHWKEPWVAVKKENYSLQNPDSLTKVIGEVDFSFLNLDSTTYKFNKNTAKDTAVIIQILGSWCPNCLDETEFLSGIEKTYSNKPLKIIGISFESKDNFAYYKKQISQLKSNTNINYDILFGGKASKKLASDTLTFIDEIKSFPTTIVLDKKHQIKKVHTGFYGHGTGSYYHKFKEDFTLLMDKILSE